MPLHAFSFFSLNHGYTGAQRSTERYFHSFSFSFFFCRKVAKAQRNTKRIENVFVHPCVFELLWFNNKNIKKPFRSKRKGCNINS